ncbi:hypothetical protein CMI37_33960 [Candidatus Pacearchaeota archaeon]|nr:hypothetical protein [Candidatus Pacearchaeota archaeon]|tara:strand:+ start:129 stop:497 length:369 start_codon:yes stop_codon:yes gene_type:complete
MPKKKKETAEATVITVSEAIEEVKPKKHIVMIKVKKFLPNIPVPIEFQVGEIRYWESTDDITYSYEAGYQQYMDSFVNRAIQIDKNKWIPRESTRKWLEHLPQAMLIDNYFTSEVLTLDEVE